MCVFTGKIMFSFNNLNKDFSGAERKFAIFFIVLLMIYICVISFCYPLQGDDFFFASQYRDQGFFNWLKEVYFNWTLRLGEIFNILQFSIGKTLFNLLNPFIQFFLALSLFSFAHGRKINFRDPADCITLALLFTMSAVLLARPRDTVYWMTGANVYAFGLALWFGFWGYIMRMLKQDSCCTQKPVLCFIWGLLAAMALENSAMCGAGIGFFLFEYTRLIHKKISGAVKSGLLGYALGLILFLSQPGRWQRLQVADTPDVNFFNLVFEVGSFHIVSAFFAFVLLGISGVLLWHLSREKFKTEIKFTLILILLSVISSGCFILSGVTPAMRAYLFSALLTAAAAVRMLTAVAACGNTGKICYKIMYALITSIAILQLSLAVPDFIQIYRDQHKRDEIIRQAAKETEVTVPAHSTVRRTFFQYVWIEDITADSNNPFNINCAKYYRLPALKTSGNTEAALFWKKR